MNSSSKEDYSFLEHHVDISNLGEHDSDNSFLFSDFLIWQFPSWKKNHEDCIPIGICSESTNGPDGWFVAMVFEDAQGNRYYTHVPASWVEEAKVVDKGWEACQEAQRKWIKNRKD